jgi:hypothetical protein
MGGGQSKNTPLECVLKIFKREFKGDYGFKLTPGKLRTFCEIDWPAFGVRWPSEGSLDDVIINRVFEILVGEQGYPDQFPYIDCWQDAVLSWSMWLIFHLEEAYRVMVARVAGASKFREKCKKPEKPITVGDPEKIPPPYVPLYPPLPPPSSSLPPSTEGDAVYNVEAPAANTPIKLSPGVLESATTPPSSGPMNLLLTPSPPVLTPQLPVRLTPRLNKEHLNSPSMDLASPL